MRIEQQVCTLEQAKKLKELGIEQDSMVAFAENSASKIECGVTNELFEQHCKDYEISVHPGGFVESFEEQSFCAYNVAELLCMMPERTSIDKGHKNYHAKYWWGDFMDGILRSVKPNSWHQCAGDTAADALARLLIYLLEEKLITPEEVNNRLNHI